MKLVYQIYIQGKRNSLKIMISCEKNKPFAQQDFPLIGFNCE